MMPPIALVDILDHLLAPLVLEIYIDVRRLTAFFRYEALEQKIDLFRINFGDAEAITDDRIRRRSTALAQNALRTCEAHNVMHREKIRRVFELGGDCDLVIECTTNL